jgi:uncharacterized membrane protein
VDQAVDHPTPSADPPLPVVRQVATGQALVWLRQGYDDMRRLGAPSWGHGVFVAGFGIFLLILGWGAPYLVPAFAGGFLLVAPFAAIGLYALSRQLESGEPISVNAALFAWRRNAGSIALFGLLLALAWIFWERVAAIVFAMFYEGTATDASHLMRDVLLGGDQPALLLLAFFGAGGVIAAVVFALAVVTVPMLLDRPEADVVSAGLTSLRCCVRNPGATMVWAALLVAIIGLGFATAMLGLVVVFPLLGHASWHAYRDMVQS